VPGQMVAREAERRQLKFLTRVTKRDLFGSSPHIDRQRRLRSCIGGQGTEPYEQNTQQSPGLGRSAVPQPGQS
jgi:hypothetical protein